MLTTYPACFFKEETGYSVLFADLPCATCGDTLDEAIMMDMDCLAGYIFTCREDGDHTGRAQTANKKSRPFRGGRKVSIKRNWEHRQRKAVCSL